MRKGIHPLLRRLQLVTTQGASTTVWSTLAARDGRSVGVAHAGWRVLVVWECELKDEAALDARLRAVLAR